MLRVALIAALSMAAATALAEDEVSLVERPEHDFQWQAEAPPNAYQKAMSAGDELTLRATRFGGQRSRGLAQRAVRSYEHAASLDPRAAEPHYRAGLVLYIFMIRPMGDVPDPAIVARTLTHWDAFERLAPLDLRLGEALFNRSLVLTQMATEESFRRGISIYKRLSQMRSSDDPTHLYNRAELHMMLGELDESIEFYRQALDVRNDAAYGYGLAVALDRDGQGVKALQVMHQYAYGDRLRSLAEGGTVFFVPDGERHYYLGLGWEALGNYQLARVEFEKFVKSGAHPIYQPRAQEHLERLRARLKNQRGRRPGREP